MVDLSCGLLWQVVAIHNKAAEDVDSKLLTNIRRIICSLEPRPLATAVCKMIENIHMCAK